MLLYKNVIMSYCKLMLINPHFYKNNISFIEIPNDLKLNDCLNFGEWVNRFPNTMFSEASNF
jgi:hypothetical protein